MPVKIVIVEDHELFREGIVSVLGRNPANQVIGKYSNGKDFIESLTIELPQIVLMDISMPVMDGISATRQALLLYPELKILVLSMFDDYLYYQEMLNAGVKGFILKDADIGELDAAIESLINNKSYFSNKLLQSIIKRQYDKNVETKDEIFSERELNLIKMICQGLTNKEIAERMFVSIKTIENNKSKLFERLNVSNSIELVAYAVKNKLVSY